MLSLSGAGFFYVHMKIIINCVTKLGVGWANILTKCSYIDIFVCFLLFRGGLFHVTLS